ncbi:MAG: nicotinate phosphoribosyltransferase [Candidatus Korarchaeota archaeon]
MILLKLSRKRKASIVGDKNNRRQGTEFLIAPSHFYAKFLRKTSAHVMKWVGGYVTSNELTLLTDLYELTMAQAYFKNNINYKSTFDLFVRSLPQNRGFLIFAGLEQVVDYITNLRFNSDAIEFLKVNGFADDFLSYLEKFKFSGDVVAFQEGTPFFAEEPVIRVTAPIIEAQLLETAMMNIVHFQTLVATKAVRCALAAKGRNIVDFGLRRAHGTDAGIKAARAAYIGGAVATSNVLAGKIFNIPITGTVAHSYIMAHKEEKDAFRSFAKVYPNKLILLVDTYDVKKGVENAIAVAKELSIPLRAVRIDSGDLIENAWVARKILDEAGFRETKIVVSGDLDEYKIEEICSRDAPVDMFGVGTRLVTSSDCPYLGMNYKLAAIEVDGQVIGTMKLSEGKRTLPGIKKVTRIIEKGMAVRDMIGCEDEEIEGVPLQKVVIKNGEVVARPEPLSVIRDRVKEEVALLPPEVRKLRGAGSYPVVLTEKLEALLAAASKNAVKG